MEGRPPCAHLTIRSSKSKSRSKVTSGHTQGKAQGPIDRCNCATRKSVQSRGVCVKEAARQQKKRRRAWRAHLNGARAFVSNATHSKLSSNVKASASRPGQGGPKSSNSQRGRFSAVCTRPALAAKSACRDFFENRDQSRPRVSSHRLTLELSVPGQNLNSSPFDGRLSVRLCCDSQCVLIVPHMVAGS